jgi:transposase
MFSSPFLPLPAGLKIATTTMRNDLLVVQVVSTKMKSCCPLCFCPAERRHSQYTRVVADLPCAGFRVQLILHVRRFFCDHADCIRKIFTERLPAFVLPWARLTVRLCEALQSLGLATCGELGTRLAARLAIQTSPTTILRRLMVLPTSAVGRVVELGIDDFAFRRGKNFGSILVDMQSHKVIDLLADRKAETAKAWMQAHPEIKIVSRDRGGEYAAGAREGAPQATQIADRFHLYKNLVEAVALILARCRAEIRKNAQSALHEEVPEPLLLACAEVISVENWKQAPALCDERKRLTRRAERHDRYQQVIELHAQGLGVTEIARRVGLSRRTLERWIKKGDFPEAKRRRKRRSAFDPYAEYVLKRWEAGCENGSQLWREIKDQGYQGSAQTVYRFLISLRKKQRIIWKPEVPHAPLQDFSANDAVWLFARDPTDLDENEQETLSMICQASETARTTYQFVQEFRYLLHHREGEKLDDWLANVTKSQIRELRSFVLGIERDKAAVVAGLTLPQNNGMVEGNVNKLKLIKRMMYGRAEFPLLRQRVLHAL